MDKAGRTPLHEAARLGREGAVRALLAAGADPGAKDASGKTPEALAEEAHKDGAAALLAGALGHKN